MKYSSGNNSERAGAARVSWDPAKPKAVKSYILGYRYMTNGPDKWITASIAPGATSYSATVLYGRYMQFRVRAVRDAMKGKWKTARPVRMIGIPSNRVYVALGDSYSSGLGATPTASGDCLQSTGAWANLLASRYNTGYGYGTDYRDDFYLRACAGATSTEVRTKQLAAMDYFFKVKKGRPQLITLTAGGNDIDFSDVVKACATGKCAGDRDALYKKITGAATLEGGGTLPERLAGLYTDIRRKHPYADIVVGGYPGLFEVKSGSHNSLCWNHGFGVGEDERRMLSGLAPYLNDVISQEAAKAGVWSVGRGILDEFKGHNACVGGDAEWLHTLSHDFGGGQYKVFDKKVGHPKEVGQEAYARVFEATIRSKAGLR